MRALFSSIVALAIALLPAGALAADPPLKFVGPADKATITVDGAPVTFYKVTPAKPIRIATSGSMTLILTARAMVVETDAAPPSPALGAVVSTTAGSAALVTMNEKIPVDSTTRIPVSSYIVASAPKTVRVPIAKPSAFVEITAEAPGVLVAFSRAAYAAPIAAATTKTEPRLDDAVLAAIPMIRKSVERFSVGAKGGVLVPAGADQGFGGFSNLYAGAELRFTPPQLERRFSVSIEGGVYQVRDRETILGTEPIGSSEGGDVVIATRVSPLLVGAGYRMELGEYTGIRVAAGAGASFNARTERVDFRDDSSQTDTRPAAFVRTALDRKIGRGRALALEVGWLHVPGGSQDPYAGGFMTAIHYRVLY